MELFIDEWIKNLDEWFFIMLSGVMCSKTVICLCVGNRLVKNNNHR